MCYPRSRFPCPRILRGIGLAGRGWCCLDCSCLDWEMFSRTCASGVSRCVLMALSALRCLLLPVVTGLGDGNCVPRVVQLLHFACFWFVQSSLLWWPDHARPFLWCAPRRSASLGPRALRPVVNFCVLGRELPGTGVVFFYSSSFFVSHGFDLRSRCCAVAIDGDWRERGADGSREVAWL